MISILSITLVLLCLSSCDALSQKPGKSMLSEVFSRNQANRPSLNSGPTVDQGELLLKELNLTAATKPVRFGARAEQIPNLLSASLPAVLRGGSGVFAQDYKISLVPQNYRKYTVFEVPGDMQIEETGVFNQPKEPIILYEFEPCPFCRKVREACSMLSLSVTFRPTPRPGRRYRQEIKAKYGPSATFPYMIDPNTGISMFESDDIIRYLFKVYGNGQVPWTLQPKNFLVTLTAGLGVGLARLGAGGSYRDSNPPDEPVLLWAYEGSPFCKVVRETLCSLEIPHTLVFTPRGSANRQRLFETKGMFQVPYLEDPNTGVCLFESEAINEYLVKQYGVAKPTVPFI